MLQLNRLCKSLTKGFTFSKVTHKRLLAKEVPRRLAAAFVQQAQTAGWKACSSTDLMRTLCELVTGLLSNSSHQGSTAPALRQQLQQAGLWEALPGILSAAAAELEASTGQIAALQASKLYRSNGIPMPHCALFLLVLYVVRLISLLTMFSNSKLWGGSSILQSPLASSAEPALHLAAAAIQFICSYQEQRHEDVVPAVAQAITELFIHIELALAYVSEMVSQAVSEESAVSRGHSASSSTAGRGVSLQQQLLLSPHWRRVSGVWLVAYCYALLHRQEYPATACWGCTCSSGNGCGSGGSKDGGCDNNNGGCCGSSSSSGSTSSSGSSSRDVIAETVWAQGMADAADTRVYRRAATFAAEWQHELPASHQQLLQLLGCSSKGVLWVAGMSSESNWQGDPLGLLAAAHTSTRSWAHECASQQRQAGEQCAGTATSSADAAVDVLLASVMLHCAAHYPSRPQRFEYIRLCGAATNFAFCAWSGPVRAAVDIDGPKEAEDVPIEQVQARLAGAQQLAAAEREHGFFLQHILSRVLKMLREDAAHAEGGSSAGCLSSGDPVSTGSSSCSRHLAPTILAVSRAVQALALVDSHCIERHNLQSFLAAVGPCRGEGPAARGTRAGLGAGLTASLQDCMRLGATVEHLQPLWGTVTYLCTPDDIHSVPRSAVLVGLAAPPGSPQQQQLFGLMCSLLKAVQLQAGAASGRGQVEEYISSAVACADSAVIAITMQQQRKASSASPLGSAVGSSGSVRRSPVAATIAAVPTGTRLLRQAASALAASGAAARAAAVQHAENCSVDRDALLLLPWLVLFGRCCLTMAQCFSHSVDQAMDNLPAWLPVLQSWLQDSSTAAQLSAAGLNPGALLQALQDTSTALQHLQDKSSGVGGAGVGSSTDVQQLQDQGSEPAAADSAGGMEGKQLTARLYALGVALSSLPLSWGCNNPLCTNLQGPAEAGIVHGKGHKCNGCHMAYYCGKACQAQHWKQHKPVCKAVAAAASAGKP